MMIRNWTDSISIRLTDKVLDWLEADRQVRALAALDDRALADFAANRCDVEKQLKR